MEFENAFSRPGKVMEFRENGRGHGKVMEFHFFWSKDFMLFENWKNLLVTEQKYAPKRLGFQHFRVMENLNWS